MATATVDRIDPQEAKRRMDSVPGALLVCAYDSPAKFEQYRLEGAISLEDFRSRSSDIDKDREIIFYCA